MRLVFKTRRPAAWSWSTSQRSIQVPTRLPMIVFSPPTSAGRGHRDHAAEADDRVGAPRASIAVASACDESVPTKSITMSAPRPPSAHAPRRLSSAPSSTSSARAPWRGSRASRRCPTRSSSSSRAVHRAGARYGRHRRLRSGRLSFRASRVAASAPHRVVRGEACVGVRRHRRRLDRRREAAGASAPGRPRSRRSLRRP